MSDIMTPTHTETHAKAQAPTPIPGISHAKLAGSARASKLIGSKIFKADTPIGHIQDVLLDFDNAAVNAVILSIGGILGIGQKLVAVPVNEIMVGKEAKFTTALTEEQLSSAPVFEFDPVEVPTADGDKSVKSSR